MIWMSWRQFRTQAVVAAATLAVIAIYLVILGTQIRHTYNVDLAQCHSKGGGCGALMTEFEQKYSTRLYFLDALLIAAPGLLGIFWGAPLVARELEAGTLRLVWNQSVTRRRWLAVKLLFVGLASMVAAGLVSLLLTWAASPFDHVVADRFTSLLFGTRNIAPVAYAAFAFVLGTSIGLMVRRTVPAMALTVLVFAVVQGVMPALVREHLSSPVTASQPMTAETIKNLSFLGSDGNIGGLKIPGAFVVSVSKLLASNGQPVDPNQYNVCTSGLPESAAPCLAKLNLHVQVAYQPADRYWDFQWLESAIFLALSVLLAGFGLWRIQGRLT
jgi:ABC-type transport system involved in multi-copper enzyme maturation permease subunit